MNHFFLCDSPTLESGFARVSKNLLPRLNVPNKHVWALGYNGEPHSFDMKLYPANVNSSWEHPENVRRFFDWLLSFPVEEGAVLWTLHDPFRLRAFMDGFWHFRQRGGKIVSYIPIDSRQSAEDLEMLHFVDVAVAYTDYGALEIRKSHPSCQIFIIPHGYDPDFVPVDGVKELAFPQFEDKCLIGCVNSNSTRKALHRSVEVLAELREISDNYVMYIHADPSGAYNLKEISSQLNVSESIVFAGGFFDGSRIGSPNADKNALIGIYNSFDVLLSTSYGEGWGLTVSEAASCNVPICIPRHSAFESIYREDSALWIPIENTAYYEGKIVPDINPKTAAKIIDKYVTEEFFLDDKRKNAKHDVERHNWDDIANQWNRILNLWT